MADYDTSTAQGDDNSKSPLVLSKAQIDQIFDHGGLYLEGARAKRFMNAISSVCMAQESLFACSALFPSVDADRDEVDPQYAVESFAKFIEKKMSLILSALVDEDYEINPLSESEGVCHGG